MKPNHASKDQPSAMQILAWRRLWDVLLRPQAASAAAPNQDPPLKKAG